MTDKTSTKMTLGDFVATGRTMTAAEFVAWEDRPVDDLRPGMRAIAYTFDFAGGPADYVVLEAADGYHYTFLHPVDEVAPTLAEAERLLYEFIVGETA